MGNCLLGGLGDEASSSSDGSGGGGSNSIIKVMTSNGGIMELNGAVTVGSITSEFFPGHAIFPTHDLFWRPLSPEEDLLPGHSYYLFPLNNADDNDNDNGKNKNHNKLIVREGHVRSKSIPVLSNNINVANANASAPYRMSLDCQGMLKRSYTEVLSSTTSSSSSRNSRYKYSNIGNGNNNNKNMGFWKVKLVIRSEQLLEILSQEARTEELIESVRTVAKCGNPRINNNNNNNNNNGFSNISSDQWSLPASSSSSRSASTTTNCNQN